MLRRALRSAAAWAGIPLAPAASEASGSRLFSTDLKVGQRSGAAALAAQVEIVKKAKVTYGAVATTGMDAKDCGAGAGAGVFDGLDPNAAVTDALMGWFASQTFIGYAMAAMLSQHWLIDKACSMPARDAVRHGFLIDFKGLDESTAEDDDAVNALKDDVADADRRWNLKHHMQDFVRMGRVFGIRLALFRVDLGSEAENDAYYENPFNPDSVKPGTYRGIRQIDQYWVSPVLDTAGAGDPTSDEFYTPTWWMVGGRRIHRTHFCIFRATEVPDNLKPYYLFGGVPVPQRIMERVYAAERTANEAPMLALAKRLYVWKTSLEEAMARPDEFIEHLAKVSALQNNFGIKVVDLEDEVSAFDTSLADLDAVIMNQFQLVAAGANVPATKLLGTTPKGFQSTGEFESKSYHEELETIQENDLTPFVDRHHLMVGLSEGWTFQVVHTWAPVDSPTAKDYAEINKLNAETDAALVNAGILDPEDSRARLRADPNSNHVGIPPEAHVVETPKPPVVVQPEAVPDADEA